MKCPFCGSDKNEVLESRVVEKGEGIRRRRGCSNCLKRFTTFERVRKETLWVVKKDGKREPFDREKVKKGVLRAIEKRPVSLQLVDDVVNEVEMEMLRRGSEEVATKIIGKSVLNRLKRIDKVAWLRFASVYLQFEDLSDFEKAIEDA